MIPALLALFVLANVAALVGIAMHYRAENKSDLAVHDIILLELNADLLEVRGDLAERDGELNAWVRSHGDLAHDLEWERIAHAVTAADRDMYATAFRGEMRRQTNAELLHPDEPVGVATVLDFPAAGMHKGGGL
jgi:hypothetical protein